MLSVSRDAPAGGGPGWSAFPAATSCGPTGGEQLAQVVDGADEVRFGRDARSAAEVKAAEAAGLPHLGEERLDDRLACELPRK